MKSDAQASQSDRQKKRISPFTRDRASLTSSGTRDLDREETNPFHRPYMWIKMHIYEASYHRATGLKIRMRKNWLINISVELSLR
ncbi:hypothetical protein NPIL_345231 [Nephila pilipes]|uniref:Uncharacterized protein n=1 Tax=Nephila pilipes TaxID=299642 RepID=A0A8X6NG45_NEPPI|nr:hypothetical protein NPIL_345231 [Nephila pilipes]